MTNIAQVVNVLQSMILTKGKQMVLTPTYYVFEMYSVHQDATYLPMDIICNKVKVRDNEKFHCLAPLHRRINPERFISLWQMLMSINRKR